MRVNMCDSEMEGLLFKKEAVIFQDCFLSIRTECSTDQRYVGILPVFHSLFSTGIPIIVWFEFIHLARKQLADLEVRYIESERPIKSQIWPTIERIAQIEGTQYEMQTVSGYDPDASPPRYRVRCGVIDYPHFATWLNYMRPQLSNNQLFFLQYEIDEMISTLQHAFSNSICDRLEGDWSRENTEDK
jgi:hypothetical protein